MSSPSIKPSEVEGADFVAIAVFVETWVYAPGFKEVPSALPLVLQPKLMKHIERDDPAWAPEDAVLAQIMDGVSKLRGVTKFNAVSLEIPQRHLFDKTYPEVEGTYVWLRWRMKDAAPLEGRHLTPGDPMPKKKKSKPAKSDMPMKKHMMPGMPKKTHGKKHK